MSKPKKIYLLTGSNLGDRIGNLMAAAKAIGEQIGQVTKTSHFYETQAWGKVDQPDYINQALEVLTQLSPHEVLEAIWRIEAALGRTRRSKWEPRPIDIDILFYENKVLSTPELTIPHPLLQRRNFALIPMLEIAPLKRHPILKLTIEELYEASTDDLDVIMLETEDLPR